MAQKREKEESELKVYESLSLCAPLISTPPGKISSSGGVSEELNSNSSTVRSPEISNLKGVANVDLRSSTATSPKKSDMLFKAESMEVENRIKRRDMNRMKRRDVNWCSGCQKKVGLMGFWCRCGEMFCLKHRYFNRHHYSFDYKIARREVIARENLVVRATKILKV